MLLVVGHDPALCKTKGRTFKDRPVFGYFYDQGQALYFINELPSMPHVGRDTFRRVGSWESGSFKTVVLDSCGDEVWRQKADGVGRLPKSLYGACATSTASTFNFTRDGPKSSIKVTNLEVQLSSALLYLD
jgi:hypothetical protein